LNKKLYIWKKKKLESPQLKSNTPQSPLQRPQYNYQNQNKPSTIDVNYSKDNQNYPMYGSSYSNKYGVSSSSYHLNAPLSAPVENQYRQPSATEQNETSNYYNIINAIKRENLNNINTTSKSLNTTNNGSFNPNNSFTNSPPLSPLPVNINNQKFYKNTQPQTQSAVDLSRPDLSFDEPKSSKSVKDYSMSGSASSANVISKQKAKSIHNVNPAYEEDISFDYINDSITEYSFSQKDNYEGSVLSNNSEKDRKGHSRSLSKSLKRAVSRNSRKSKKSHRRNTSTSSKGKESYSSSIKQPEVPPIPPEFSDNALVFKPASGAITSYGDVLGNDNSFDFETMISSDQTRKISLTPNRMNEIQKHQQTANNRLKPKSHERENLVPMNVINGTIGRNKKMSNMNNMNNMNMNMMDDYDSDDSIDRLLNDGKPKRKQETLWEFLKNSSPEDFMGKGKAAALTGNKPTTPAKPAGNNGSQAKYIPIKIQYSPFDNMENKENNNNNKPANKTIATNTEENFNSNNMNNINYNHMNYNNNAFNNNNNQMNYNNNAQTMPYQKKPMNDYNVPLSSSTLPVSKRSSSKTTKINLQAIPTPPPHGHSKSNSNSMKLAQTISTIARTPDSFSTDEDSSITPIQPPVMHEQIQPTKIAPKPKPKMVSVGTQWYISDAFLMRKKRVLFRPVDRRNPIAKYMFNHAFVETIYVSNETFKKRRANAPEVVPTDFLARNFYYYSRYPSTVPQMPKVETIEWDYPERDANPIAKNMFLVQEGDYPWRDANPIAKYIFNGWNKKETCSNVINSEYLINYNEEMTNDIEMEIINDVLIEDEAEKSVEIIKTYNDDNESNNEDKTEINDETTLTTSSQSKKSEIESDLQKVYTQQDKNEIVNKLFSKIIDYLEDKEEKQKDNNKTQEFAKLMFAENTKLQKELTKLRSELSAERVLRETAEEELASYRTLMQTTLLNGN